MLVLYRCKYNHFLEIIKLLIIKLLIKSFFSHREYYLCHADYADPADFSSHTEVFYNIPQKSRKSQKGLRPAMRNVIKTHTDLTDHTDLFSVLPFIVRFFRYKYISAKSARPA